MDQPNVFVEDLLFSLAALVEDFSLAHSVLALKLIFEMVLDLGRVQVHYLLEGQFCDLVTNNFFVEITM